MGGSLGAGMARDGCRRTERSEVREVMVPKTATMVIVLLDYGEVSDGEVLFTAW